MTLLSVTLLRLLIPLAILVWPLGGMVASITLDAVDREAVAVLKQDYSRYEIWDKTLDLYYLTLAWLTVRSWPNLTARRTGTALWAWRAAGTVAFMVKRWEPLLFIFPNLFEFFFLYYLIQPYISRKSRISRQRLTTALLILGGPKMIQEYFMHINQQTFWHWMQLAREATIRMWFGS